MPRLWKCLNYSHHNIIRDREGFFISFQKHFSDQRTPLSDCDTSWTDDKVIRYIPIIGSWLMSPRHVSRVTQPLLLRLSVSCLQWPAWAVSSSLSCVTRNWSRARPGQLSQSETLAQSRRDTMWAVITMMCNTWWSHRHDDDGLGDHTEHPGDGDLGPPRPRDLAEAGLWPLDPGGLGSASLLSLLLVRLSQSVNRSVTQIVCSRNYFSHSNWTWVTWEMWNIKWNMHHQNISFLLKCFMSYKLDSNWKESVSSV